MSGSLERVHDGSSRIQFLMIFFLTTKAPYIIKEFPYGWFEPSMLEF